MLKRYITPLLLVLLLSNITYAKDTYYIPKSDSTYSKFNIHTGLGLFNGLRLGFDYHISEYISISGDYGLSPLFFWDGGYQVINTSLNYHVSEELPYILSTSFTKKNSRAFNDTRVDYYIFQNFGWLFKLNHNQSLQLRTGPGIIISYENGKYRNWVVRPNLDIILNIHF